MDLLRRLARWTRTPRPDGAELRDELGHSIRIRVGAPLAALTEIVRRELDEEPLRAERFATIEGEPAVLARTASGTCAIVVGDHDAVYVIGRGTELSELVREIARHSFLGAGELRRRRFVYVPPERWHPIARPNAARWLHPDFPRRAHSMVVHHARPYETTDVEIADRLLVNDPVHGLAILPPTALAVASSEHGLVGTFARIDLAGEPRTVVRAMLRDIRFAYVVELAGPTSSIGEELSTLHRLVASIEPVKASSRTSLAERFVYWGD